MSALVDKVLLGLLIRVVGVTVEHSVILNAVGVDSTIRHVLATESANHIEFLEFRGILVYEPSPFFHLVSGFFVEFILIEIILLFELLLHFPNHIIFEFEEAALLLIMLDQKLALGKFSRQIVRVNIDIDLELLGDRILYIFVHLAVVVKESNLIGETFSASICNFFHEHKNLIDASDVLLNFAQIMGENSGLYAFSRLEPLDNSSILVSDIALNDLLD